MIWPARTCVIALTLALGLGAGGCGPSGPPRFQVSGTVTFGGQPVPAGVIYFDPDVTKGHDGPQGYAQIKDGHYDTRQEGKPVTPGPHVVRIQGFDGKSANELPLGQPLFPQAQQNRDMPAADSTQDFSIPAP